MYQSASAYKDQNKISSFQDQIVIKVLHASKVDLTLYLKSENCEFVIKMSKSQTHHLMKAMMVIFHKAKNALFCVALLLTFPKEWNQILYFESI